MSAILMTFIQILLVPWKISCFFNFNLQNYRLTGTAPFYKYRRFFVELAPILICHLSCLDCRSAAVWTIVVWTDSKVVALFQNVQVAVDICGLAVVDIGGALKIRIYSSPWMSSTAIVLEPIQ